MNLEMPAEDTAANMGDDAGERSVVDGPGNDLPPEAPTVPVNTGPDSAGEGPSETVTGMPVIDI